MALHFQPLHSRRKHQPPFQPLAEINVTPLVDVMLVLLIVFMVTAPLLTVGIQVDLPETEAAHLSQQVEPLVVSITKKGKIYIQESLVSEQNLITKLQAVTKNNTSLQIFVRGDGALAYGEIMRIMGHISAAGYSKVTLLAEVPKR